MTKRRLSTAIRFGAALLTFASVLTAGAVTTFTVTDTAFGATPNDASDDAIAIQKALDRAKTATAASPIKVHVPAGTYMLGRTLSIWSNTTLELASGAVLRRLSTSTDKTMLAARHMNGAEPCPQDATCRHYGHTQLTDVTVCGGEWDAACDGTIISGMFFLPHGNRITVRDTVCRNCTDHLFNFSGSANVLVENVTLRDSVKYIGTSPDFWSGDYQYGDEARYYSIEAIHLDITDAEGEAGNYPEDGTVCENVTVRNCVFTGVFAGVGNHHVHSNPARRGSGFVVSNCTFSRLLSYGVTAYGFSSGSITDNEQSGGMVFFRSEASTLTVSGNNVSSVSGYGFLIHEDTDLALVGNRVQDAAIHGIYLAGGKAAIRDNEIVTTGNCGLMLDTAAAVPVTGNFVSNTVSYALCAVNGASLTATGNRLVDAGNAAISLDDCGASRIATNTILRTASNAGARIAKMSKGVVTFEGNSIFDTAGVGIQLEDCAGVRLLGNAITSPGDHGIVLAKCTGTVIRDNTVADAGKNGLQLEFLSGDIAVSGNTLSRSMWRGIYIAKISGATCVISGNTIDTTGNEGVYYHCSTGGDIVGNDISGAQGIGIRVEGIATAMATANIRDNTVVSAASAGDIRVCSYSDGCTVSGNVCGGVGFMMDAPAVDGTTYRPVDATITSVEVTSADTATVKWSNVVEATKYLVEYDTSSDFADPVSLEVTDGSGQCELSDLSSAAEWYVRVRTYRWYYSRGYESPGDEKFARSFMMSDSPDVVHYSVHFDPNGGEGAMADQTGFRYGYAKKLALNAYVRAGYLFAGWAMRAAATTPLYTDGANLTSPEPAPEKGGTVTLYAVWTADPMKYSVHFDGNGATSGTMADQHGFAPGKGGTTLHPNQFARIGYDFLGWAKFPKSTAPLWTDGAILNTSTSIGTTLTLYAVWQYNPGRTYTVAFDANGGAGVMADQVDFVNGEPRALAPNAFVRDGYVFKGWSRSLTASSATYADGAPITNSSPNVAVGHTMTLFAVWEADATCCTAHFDANGGTGEMADQLGFHVGKPHALARNVFVRAGYAFKGWATTPDATAASVADGASYTTTAAAGSTFTLYAVWAVDTTKYTVRFDGNGATAGEMADQLGFNSGKGGVNLNVNRFVRPGYKFWGWSNFPKSAEPKWTDGQTLVTSTAAGATLTVYAIWQAADDTYSILFDANGGTGTMPMQQGVASGVPTALTASAFTREGYAFKGWARSPSTTSVAYADGAAVSLPAAAFDDATLKLYAVWEPLANYTVVFNKNDGTAAKTSKTYKPGVRVQLPRATIPSGLDWAREGYAFKGWAYSSGATIAVIDDWTVVQDLAAAGETVNLYGVWSPLDTVTFDMQGGGGGTTFVNAERDDLLPRIKTLPSRYGFVFQGYFSAPDGAGTRYYNADGTGTQVWDGTGDATLYASWVSDGKFTVVLHKNDGTGVEHVVVVEEGKGVALPGGASDLKWAPRRGFTYMGWSDSEKSKVVKFKDKENMRAYFKAGEVVHVYAIWQLNLATSYAIQYIRNDGSGSVRTIGFVGGVDTKLNSVAALGFARRGYTFVGWATSTENARNKVVWRPDMGTVSQPIANGKLLPVYAIWTLKAGFYSIRFNKNDGSGKWRELGYEYGKNTTLPTIVNGLGWGRDGYTFVGWATSKANADAGTIWRGDAGITKTPIAAGRTLSLYAVWRVSAASAVASAPSGASVTSAGNASMVRERTWIEPALEVGETCLHGVLTDGGTYDLIVDANGTTGYARIETATDVVASECAVDAGEEILTARLEDGTVLVIFGDGSAVVE